MLHRSTEAGPVVRKALMGVGREGGEDKGPHEQHRHLSQALCAGVLREGFLEEVALVPGLRHRSELDKGKGGAAG